MPRPHAKPWIAVVLLALLALPGCGAVGNLCDLADEGEGVPLGGTQWDVQLIRDDFYLAVVDMPFSFVVDVVSLPFTVPFTVLRGRPGEYSWYRAPLSHRAMWN